MSTRLRLEECGPKQATEYRVVSSEIGVSHRPTKTSRCCATIRTVLVDISINHESGGGAKVSVCSRRAANANWWRMYPSLEEAKKVLSAFGVRDDLMQGLNRPLDLLYDLNSREPIDFPSIDVPEDVLAKYGFKVVG
ncbi:MAG TPA: hypothetical protein VJQ54_21140 [Candidatus Sulfotelmatobacter sp.]|nr:hypothetical protein [Candidatus Sulfotelmatobacter sp.]